MGYTAIMALAILAFGVGNLLAILLVLFVPGYVLIAVLFPKRQDIDWIERIVLSFGMSVVVVPLLGLLLNFTPWGIHLASIVVTITLFTLGLSSAAYHRRMQLLPAQRLSLTIGLQMPASKKRNALEKGMAIALAASIVVAAGTLGYVILTPRPGETFTEFYILGPGGNASGYPTNRTPSEPGTVIVGVINHEAATVAYAVRVDLVGVDVVFDVSCKCNQTQDVNRTSLASFNQSLATGANWTHRYTFWINSTGLWKLQFLLFKDGDFSSAYQELHFFVRVS